MPRTKKQSLEFRRKKNKETEKQRRISKGQSDCSIQSDDRGSVEESVPGKATGRSNKIIDQVSKDSTLLDDFIEVQGSSFYNPEDGQKDFTETALMPHNEVFRDISYTEILSGSVPVNLMDYISFRLRTQYNVQHGLFSLSYLYAKMMCANESLPDSEIIPEGVFGIQIHCLETHFLVSCQLPPNIYVIDSLRNTNYLSQVLPQVKLLYRALQSGSVTDSSIRYIVPQSQGCTVDCGAFAVANTVSLLNNIELFSARFSQSRMRSHIFQCLYNGHFSVFPCEKEIPSGTERYSQWTEVSRKRQFRCLPKETKKVGEKKVKRTEEENTTTREADRKKKESRMNQTEEEKATSKKADRKRKKNLE